MIRITNIKIYEDISNEDILNNVIKKYNIKKENILDWHISKNLLMLEKR